MISQKNRPARMWMWMVTAVVLWVLGTGLVQNIGAQDDDLYEGLKVFADVIELVQREYVDEVDAKDLIEKAIQGMVQSLDPHSSLLPKDAFEDLQIDTKGKFTGIGIHITLKDGFVTVISPIEDTPAFRAGIEAGDRIIKVDGQKVSDLRSAVKMMRGPKGTRVVVTVLREGVEEPIDFDIVRDVIPLRSVKHILLKPGYGYVRVSNFTANTTEDLEAALEELEAGEGGLKGLILDLRNNGGGLLNQAIEVADLFLDQGEILSIKGRQAKNTKVFNATTSDKPRHYPLVVLINGGSASASEIVAGALQDHKRALLLGTTSFGKGSVQTVETLRDGSGLKLTIARYYTPSGRSIQAKGIEPDIFLKFRRMAPEELEADEGLVKEKDLENHLEAVPSNRKAPQDDDRRSAPEPSGRSEQVDFRVGPLKLERLKTDNQVERALEILISYDIFKGLKR